MSQRSRRFLAAKEAEALPTSFDRHAPAAGTLTPTMSSAIDDEHHVDVSGAVRNLKNSAKDGARKAKDTLTTAADAAAAHADGYLARAKEMTAQAVEWGRNHPMRVAGAAAALLAVSGLLYQLMHRRVARRVAKVAQVAGQAKAGVKSRARKVVKSVTGRTRTNGKRATGSNRSRMHPSPA